jgi:hypothetical protein
MEEVCYEHGIGHGIGGSWVGSIGTPTELSGMGREAVLFAIHNGWWVNKDVHWICTWICSHLLQHTLRCEQKMGTSVYVYLQNSFICFPIRFPIYMYTMHNSRLVVYPWAEMGSMDGVIPVSILLLCLACLNISCEKHKTHSYTHKMGTQILPQLHALQ